MNFQPSTFELLAPPIQRWIWHQKWAKLRDVQDRAIPAVLSGGDVVVSARTAAGKTEAAFLPLLTRVLQRDANREGFAILYVSPLKALIEDQHRRLKSLCEAAGIQLHKWHGDVSQYAKSRARVRPSGLVLITPESLEALLVRRGREIPHLFTNLEAVVIDEFHAFIGSERGIQLQSILNRIEFASGRARIDRIGLSATLGDMQLAAEALRAGAGDDVTIIEGQDPGNGVALQIRGYVRPQSKVPDKQYGEVEPAPLVPSEVLADLFKLLRGGRHLLFAGSRRNVEVYASALSDRCEEHNVPNEFFAHHRNLSKAQREEVELRLRNDPRPTTAVATTTLELGLDIGDIESVVQIGPGPSVASLRQRLGRSGRRAGCPSTVRIFAIEDEAIRGHHPIDHLHLELIQCIAVVDCLIENWCEQPADAGLHLSTLLHQILALIVQHGGIRPAAAYHILCERGPFRNIDKALFATLLRQMGKAEFALIEKSRDGTLMLGAAGERITDSHEFYAVFETPKEYRITTHTATLGTYPIEYTIAPGQTLIFSGRRWKIVEINDRSRTILVQPTKAAMPPRFSGDYGGVHDHIAAKMRAVLESTDYPKYMNATAKDLLAKARAAFDAFGLRERTMFEVGTEVVLLPWVGTKKLETLSLALAARNFEPRAAKHVIEVPETSVEALTAVLLEIAAEGVPDREALTARMAMPFKEKFDPYLWPDLLRKVAVEERLDVPSVPEIARALANLK